MLPIHSAVQLLYNTVNIILVVVYYVISNTYVLAIS